MALVSMEPQIRRRRQNHTKVKSGCLTCKIRRIKCDETKPSCLRCTSTGRKCDGYSEKEPLKFINCTAKTESQESFHHDLPAVQSAKCVSRLMCSTVMASPQNPLLNFSGTEMEHRSLDFFQHEAAPSLSGYFDADFWSVLLPRIGYSELPVQHAMIAIGSLYECCRDSDGSPTVIQQRYALIQYNKAIGALKNYQADDPKTGEVTLSTCLLFVCLELLGGNPEQALDHLKNGLRILRSYKTAENRTSTSQQRSSPKTVLSQPRSIIEVLSDAFSRLSIQSSLCSRRLPEIYPSGRWAIVEDSKSARIPFSSLQEARLSLNQILIQCFQPVQPLEVSNHPSVGFMDSRKIEGEVLIEQLHYWNSRLGLYVTDSLPHLSEREIRGSHILRLLSIIAIIINTVTGTNLESAYDAYFESHETVINLALSFLNESIISSHTTTAALSSTTASGSTTLLPSTPSQKRVTPAIFTFEMGVIPALYFTAIKCRSPSLRRKALDMMKKVIPQREGLWDAPVLAAIAWRVIEIEEAQGCSDEKWPAEERRIHGIHITPGYSRMERRQDVVFTWRPNALTGEWLHFPEKIFY